MWLADHPDLQPGHEQASETKLKPRYKNRIGQIV